MYESRSWLRSSSGRKPCAMSLCQDAVLNTGSLLASHGPDPVLQGSIETLTTRVRSQARSCAVKSRTIGMYRSPDGVTRSPSGACVGFEHVMVIGGVAALSFF